MNLIQWIVEQKLAKNEFAAAHLANGLKLSEVKDFESQQARVRLYRDWRNSKVYGGKTAPCYEKAMAGEAVPQAQMSFDEDYELDDTECPQCGHSPIHSCRCRNLSCEDGWIDRFVEDSLWYDENNLEMCDECWGTGVERWCPTCGFDLQRPREENNLDREAGE